MKEEESFRDKISTIDSSGKRAWLNPLKPKGRFYDLRKYASYFYLLLFFGLPFIKVGGNPLFLINILERKFILFGFVFWPQDMFIFGLGMVIFIVFIALFTVIFGRVFCGWACPHTIFLELIFRRVEYWIDGDSAYQKQLAAAPWDTNKIIKRTSKYFIFFLISFIIANGFLSYIIGVDELFKIMSEPISKHKGGFISILIFTGVFFFIYSWFREQVCLIACPYGRMQGVLLDKNSIVVAYDYVRGEVRKKFKKNEERTAGDCVDCNLCVKVCPTGIDIRNGTQLECTNCTACIDVCDNMMEAVGLEKGLIRYASENDIKNKIKSGFTTRMKAYVVVLIVLIGVESAFLITREDYDATVIRAKGLLYQEQPDDMISNLYTIKLLNKTKDSLPVILKIEDYPDAKIEIVGKQLYTKSENMTQGEFFIYLSKKDLKSRKTKLKIDLYSNNKKISTVKTTFLGPITTTK
ncbi:MAG: cytochrome c oxidase accessory protein CcoG [Bacteroidota bacterium]|nr:cytochrome c oxidase accessory protein CcoG [Bacteroidota bacterium]